MKILYTNILPLATHDGQETIINCFIEQMKKADRVEIAVGYTSSASLDELYKLVESCNISSICLVIGMYYIEGMPERSYHQAMKINQNWRNEGIGEIRLVKAFKYHGKIFCFYKNGVPVSAIIGSANLGAIKLEASNRRQYETAVFTEDSAETAEIATHIDDLKQSNISANIADMLDVPLLRETNTALNGIELVTPIPQQNVIFYKQRPTKVSFYLQLKVPKKMSVS